jgi:DNA-binding MarR family transcriptional regulator
VRGRGASRRRSDSSRGAPHRAAARRTARPRPASRRAPRPAAELGDRDYERLATFRYALRRFLRESENAARRAKITPGQYQLLLFVRSFYPDSPSVAALAERLQVRHQSAVGLIDRCAAAGLVRRRRDDEDARRVRILLTGAGDRRLAQLVRDHYTGLDELRRAMPPGSSARRPFAPSARTSPGAVRPRLAGPSRARSAAPGTRTQTR